MVGLKMEKVLGIEEQLKLYKKGICYRCNEPLIEKRNQKQCHNCLGHFEILGRTPCFVSWEIEVKKD